MFISDLNYLEVVSEDAQIEGGFLSVPPLFPTAVFSSAGLATTSAFESTGQGYAVTQFNQIGSTSAQIGLKSSQYSSTAVLQSQV